MRECVCGCNQVVTIFMSGISGTMTQTITVCADCCREKVSGNDGEVVTIDTRLPMPPQHPKHLRIEITPKDIKAEVVPNHFYSGKK